MAPLRLPRGCTDSPRLVTAHRRPRHSLVCRGTGSGHFVRCSHLQSYKNEQAVAAHQCLSTRGRHPVLGSPSEPTPAAQGLQKGLGAAYLLEGTAKGQGQLTQGAAGSLGSVLTKPALQRSHWSPSVLCWQFWDTVGSQCSKQRHIPAHPHCPKPAGTLGLGRVYLEPQILGSSLAGQAPKHTHHTGARARKAAFRMTMALAGDTSAQEETFDVPVIARGTFLGEGR